MPANAPGVGFLQAPAGPLTPGELEEDKSKALTISLGAHEVRCGDKVPINVRSNNVDSGSSLEVEIAGAKTEKLSGKMQKRLLRSAKGVSSDDKDLVWAAKVGSKGVEPEPEITFSAKAGGASGKALEPLIIRKYEDKTPQAWTVNTEKENGKYIEGKFDIELTKGTLIVTVRVLFVMRGGPNITTTDYERRGETRAQFGPTGIPMDPARKAEIKAEVEAPYCNKFYFHRVRCARGKDCDCALDAACCKIPIKLVFNAVESGPVHHTVNVWLAEPYNGYEQSSSKDWYTPPSNPMITYPHEVGHLLGWPDEYPTGSHPKNPKKRWLENRDTFLMKSNGLNMAPEYFWDFRDWLKGGTGEDWELEKI